MDRYGTVNLTTTDCLKRDSSQLILSPQNTKLDRRFWRKIMFSECIDTHRFYWAKKMSNLR